MATTAQSAPSAAPKSLRGAARECSLDNATSNYSLAQGAKVIIPLSKQKRVGATHHNLITNSRMVAER